MNEIVKEELWRSVAVFFFALIFMIEIYIRKGEPTKESLI